MAGAGSAVGLAGGFPEGSWTARGEAGSAAGLSPGAASLLQPTALETAPAHSTRATPNLAGNLIVRAPYHPRIPTGNDRALAQDPGGNVAQVRALRYKRWMSSSGPIAAALSRRSQVARDVADLEFTLSSPARLEFRAGQFVTLQVGTDAHGRAERRSYSIASLPERGESLRFLVKVIPGGPASDLFLSIPMGGRVDMTGPHGFFVLDPAHAGDVVFAATGTGLAPVMPMLNELARRVAPAHRSPVASPVPARIQVFWGLRDEGDLFLRDEVEDLCRAAGAELRTHLSRPHAGWTGHRGRITGPILEMAPRLASPTFYLVGNGAMITELKKGLVDLGVDRKKQIRTEAFFD